MTSKFGGFARRAKEDPDSLQISMPTNFEHRSHLGWTDDATFELRNVPPEWKRFFQAAGIRKRELEDPETRRAIFAVLFNEQGSDGGSTAEGMQQVEYDDMPGLGPIIYQPSGDTQQPESAEEQGQEYGGEQEAYDEQEQEAYEEQQEEEYDAQEQEGFVEDGYDGQEEEQ